MLKILKNILGNKKNISKSKYIESENIRFNSFNSNAYEDEVYRTAVDSIARHTAKLLPKHIIEIGNEVKKGDQKINTILELTPNPYMTGYDFIYKMTTHYFINNNAFIYLNRDDRGNLKSMWILDPNHMEFLSDNDNLYCKFLMDNGKSYILNYKNIIHMRRHFNSDELLGDRNTAIMNTLELSDVQKQGINYSIRNNGKLKGILKYNQVLNRKQLLKEKEEFEEDYLKLDNTNGVASIDAKYDYIPLNEKYVEIPTKQLEITEQKIYRYLGTNEKIVSGSYNEDEYLSFYKSTIEPFALQCSLEFTNKIFTEREKTYGNKIEFNTSRLQFMSNKSKVSLLRELTPYGLITINEGRKILGLETVENGDIRVQTLNVVNADIVDEYQLSRIRKEDSYEERE